MCSVYFQGRFQWFPLSHVFLSKGQGQVIPNAIKEMYLLPSLLVFKLRDRRRGSNTFCEFRTVFQFNIISRGLKTLRNDKIQAD